jgi:hypothetical protein
MPSDLLAADFIVSPGKFSISLYIATKFIINTIKSRKKSRDNVELE